MFNTYRMSIIGVCAIYTRKRKLGLIFGVINVFNAIFITVHELSSYICVQTEKRNNVYCKKFKDALNACTWMSKYSPTSASSMSTTGRTTEISSSMEPTAIVRVVVIVLAIISLLLTIYVVLLTDIAIRVRILTLNEEALKSTVNFCHTVCRTVKVNSARDWLNETN